MVFYIPDQVKGSLLGFTTQGRCRMKSFHKLCHVGVLAPPEFVSSLEMYHIARPDNLGAGLVEVVDIEAV